MQIQNSFRTIDGTKASTGTLYIVGTPIGNLEDMSYRAIRTLREVDLIAAEDTRQTRKLLTHFEIAARVVSYHEHNKAASGPELIRLLEEGQSIALVSDAGLPGISDPGEELVRDAAERDIPVVPIPGPNAALSALVVSGLSTEQFLFAGFPPRERKGLIKWLEKLSGSDATLLVYESPHRIAKTLQAMLDVWGDRRIALVRELTKRYEEVARGTINGALQLLEERPPQGEYCIVVEGAGRSQLAGGGGLSSENRVWWEQLSETEHVRHYEALGIDRKESMRKAAADRGVSKRDIYQACLAGDNQEGEP
jgi:16S rRNA (cytidine1402-2'-O)-methyltransferase